MGLSLMWKPIFHDRLECLVTVAQDFEHLTERVTTLIRAYTQPNGSEYPRPWVRGLKRTGNHLHNLLAIFLERFSPILAVRIFYNNVRKPPTQREH